MSNETVNLPPKTAPGIVQMACRIWEPQPIKNRTSQEEHFVYNADTLNFFGNIIDSQPINSLQDSIYLKEKYVYYDTFLRNSSAPATTNTTTQVTNIVSTGAPVGYGNASLLGFKGEQLFNTDYSPMSGHPWIYHQSFVMNQSLFQTTQTASAVWALTTATVPYLAPVPDPSAKPLSASSTPLLSDFDSTVTNAADAAEVDMIANWRKSNRFFPMQTATGNAYLQYISNNTASSTSSNNTSSTPTALGVHWLAIKETRLFNAEDFFVEFKRGAFDKDVNVNDSPLQTAYQELDATLTKLTQTATVGKQTTTCYLNQGVLGSLDQQGNPDPNTQTQLNLARQPYYCIEINHGDNEDNYWIFIPYNHRPVLIRRGVFPCLVPANIDPKTPANTVPASVQQFTQPTSQLISTYDISSKTLMDPEILRITVRNHFGKLIITFSGHEDNPWIIEGKEYDLQAYQSNPSVISQKSIEMRVYPYPIQVGAGNIACGFMFGALTYETTAIISSPDMICLRGPVEQTDINLYLRDKQTRLVSNSNNNNSGNSSSGSNNGNTAYTYSQEAEVYIECEDGVATLQQRINNIDLSTEIWRIPGLDIADFTQPPPHPRPYTNDATTPYPTDNYGRISYIKVDVGSLGPQPTGTNQDPSQTDPTEAPTDPYSQFKNKYCTLRYTLGAGDMTLYANDKLRAWNLPNCITPKGNGWRLYIPTSDAAQEACPIEVAQHVINFNCSSSYTDNIKAERSGSIKFLINFGTMTGIQFETPISRPGALLGCDPFNIGDPQSYVIDQSAALSNLAGKTFFIRVYLWWNGGFMACANNTCNCGTVSTPTASGLFSTGADPRIVFTGMCAGGQITVENGKRYMECQLLDYWKILEDMKFLNSPFFDGMRDFNAVSDILTMAGFASTPDPNNRPPDNYPPALFIQNCANTNSSSFVISSYGEPWYQTDFALPSAYDLLQGPILKFGDGSSYDEAIINIAQRGSHMVYFDRYGQFMMVSRSDIRLCTMGSQATKCNFFATPLPNIGTGCTRFNVLALTNYSYSKKVSDSFNEIHMVAATPDGAILHGDSLNYAGRFDPTVDGYIGYQKRFIQIDGIFGTQEALDSVLNYYAGFYRPPITLSWESFGVSHLSAGDLVTFTGLQLDNTFPTGSLDTSLPLHTMTVYLTSVSMDVDPSRNEWKSKYEGEWIYVNQSNCANS